ncbi:MAG: RagB/SusD family nutrient uptake outer membrane protein [Bacteroidetes bacterium]|nr:MAG: RagB/SusD family nutrient uptake outer membrane protein [Bacteroidota bacterium]
MKYTVNILFAFLLLLPKACSEDFLDKDPISSFSAQGFYKTEGDAKAGVNGVYDALQGALRTNFAYWGEGRADAVNSYHSGNPQMLLENTLNKTISSASWNGLYSVISRANYAIKYVPEIYKADDEGGLQLLAQARAIRALAYFYCVRVWGDVPLITEPYESTSQNLFVERNDQETVLDQIEADLLYATVNCRKSFGGDADRIFFTQGGAYGLLTQVYMWRHKYQEAIDAAREVLDNSLYSLVPISSWTKIFASGYSEESIFELGYNEVQTNSLRVLYALGSDSDYFPSKKFRNSFETGDLRQSLIYDQTQRYPKMVWKFFGKGFNDESPDPSDNNIVLIRLADIMLLKAEAHNKLGETGAALELLNAIRIRAGLQAFTAQDAIDSYGDLESAILHERFIELCFEGHRWFDLVRTGKAIEVMNPLNGLSDEANLVWPIFEDALNRNPNLVQNPFYQ